MGDGEVSQPGGAQGPRAASPRRLHPTTRLVIFWASLVIAFLFVWQLLSRAPRAPKLAPASDPAAQPGT